MSNAAKKNPKSGLTEQQRKAVMKMRATGASVNRICTFLALTREYVQEALKSA